MKLSFLPSPSPWDFPLVGWARRAPTNFRVPSCLRPVTPLTSEMKEHYLESARSVQTDISRQVSFLCACPAFSPLEFMVVLLLLLSAVGVCLLGSIPTVSGSGPTTGVPYLSISSSSAPAGESLLRTFLSSLSLCLAKKKETLFSSDRPLRNSSASIFACPRVVTDAYYCIMTT